MNFLLYMLGVLGRESVTLRPIGRVGLQAAAARFAAEGKWQEALDGYRRLAANCGSSAVDTFIRGQLNFTCGELPEAARCFAVGIDRLLAARDDEHTSVEELVGEATTRLHAGRYVRATELLVRARAILQVVMAAEAGLLLAQEEPLDRLANLAHLEDLTLRMLARTQLARQTAAALDARQLRSDLAPWATSARGVEELLTSEQHRLAALVATEPEHAEWNYRLGLIARAAGNYEGAAAGFEGVLAVHPHHVSSAIGLAVIRERLGKPGGRKILERAFRVPAETMQLFAGLARACGDTNAFDRLAEITCGTDPTFRGNMALALSEMGVLDVSRECWREPTVAAVTT